LRGWGRVRSLTELTQDGLEAMGGDEPTPELAAQLANEHYRPMEQHDDPTLQIVATWNPEGYTDGEIAARLGCATKSVESMFARIGRIWAKDMRDSVPPSAAPLRHAADTGLRPLPTVQGRSFRGL
jgi:hypothetical protein